MNPSSMNNTSLFPPLNVLPMKQPLRSRINYQELHFLVFDFIQYKDHLLNIINSIAEKDAAFRNILRKAYDNLVKHQIPLSNLYYSRKKSTINQSPENMEILETIFISNYDLILEGLNDHYKSNNRSLRDLNNKVQVLGGKKSKKPPKKEILGKIRKIYKIPGDRKEYVKHKGKLITVKDYKKLMKAKKPKKK